jgi:hypothetical protein
MIQRMLLAQDCAGVGMKLLTVASINISSSIRRCLAFWTPPWPLELERHDRLERLLDERPSKEGILGGWPSPTVCTPTSLHAEAPPCPSSVCALASANLFQLTVDVEYCSEFSSDAADGAVPVRWSERLCIGKSEAAS